MPKKIEEYTPSKKILENYANVLVNFALGGGKGIKKGDTVIVQTPEIARPLYEEILRAVWKAGGNVIQRYSLDAGPLDKEFFQIANDKQLTYFPDKLMKATVDQADHLVAIIAEKDKKSLEGVDPRKIMARGKAFKPYMDWRNEKEHKGKFTWTIGLYGTPAMAKEARLTEKEYWQQIINACFLDKKDPVAEWKKAAKEIESVRVKLSRLPINKLHILGPDADLWITIGEKRKWLGGSGRNIPSFEVFTSPDWRGTDGWIRFNQPLYRYGNIIEGVELHFKKGCVVKSSAKKNYPVLKQMIETENADKVGEFSLTDGRISRITKFMAETLFDENIGGAEGNTHLALGASYTDTYTGNASKLTKGDKFRLGFNDSSVHTDIVSTAPRRVMAHMKDGSQKLIYENGQFTI